MQPVRANQSPEENCCAGTEKGQCGGPSGDEQIFRFARLLGRQAAEDLFQELRPANLNIPAAKMERAA
jgi:hypothetical protein